MPAQHSVLIESGSISSCEQSPKLFDRFRRHVAHDVGGSGETQLKEDLADAMLESPSNRERGNYIETFRYFLLSILLTSS